MDMGDVARASPANYLQLLRTSEREAVAKCSHVTHACADVIQRLNEYTAARELMARKHPRDLQQTCEVDVVSVMKLLAPCPHTPGPGA
jgi:predicted short-subunit dehydrogenase-like oxidoreductase (DUF2520 family)